MSLAVGILRSIARFCYDFVIGDDWKIAAAVVTGLGGGLILLAVGAPIPLAMAATAAVLAATFAAALIIDVRRPTNE